MKAINCGYYDGKMVSKIVEITSRKHLLYSNDKPSSDRMQFLLMHTNCWVTTYKGRENEGLSFDFFLSLRGNVITRCLEPRVNNMLRGQLRIMSLFSVLIVIDRDIALRATENIRKLWLIPPFNKHNLHEVVKLSK